MILILFHASYYLTAVIQLLVGALGMCFPFGILGVYLPFYSIELGQDETELLTTHLARMCQVTAFFTGILFLLLRHESIFVRGTLVLVTNAATVVYSIGEIALDAQRADRLGIDITKPEDYSRPIQFLIGCLDGGSFGTLVVSALFCCVASVALVLVGVIGAEQNILESGSKNKKQ
jgi:hypothetical protein